MKHHYAPRLAAFVLTILAAALPALAEEPDISGQWKFKTDVLPNKGCVISGTIKFKKLPAALGYSCSFVSREDCKREGGDTFTEVQQSCVARFGNGAFSIVSKVDKLLDASPADLGNVTYYPDSFDVKPNAKGDQLLGFFHSIRQAAVKFWRDVELVS